VDPAGTEALREAIRHLHGCDARLVESVAVRETHEDTVVWDGEVQVFELVEHPTAARCYAWSHATTGARRRFVAVLHAPPVDSPRAAVRAAIVQEHRAARN
jgi:hypothetical protein